jgi:hypothetical protein
MRVIELGELDGFVTDEGERVARRATGVIYIWVGRGDYHRVPTKTWSGAISLLQRPAKPTFEQDS